MKRSQNSFAIMKGTAFGYGSFALCDSLSRFESVIKINSNQTPVSYAKNLWYEDYDIARNHIDITQDYKFDCFLSVSVLKKNSMFFNLAIDNCKSYESAFCTFIIRLLFYFLLFSSSLFFSSWSRYSLFVFLSSIFLFNFQFNWFYHEFS